MQKVFMMVLASVTLYASLTLEDSEKFTLHNDENISIHGDLNISNNSIFKAGDYTAINVQKDWINHGNFIPDSTTVNFTGNTLSTIKGESTFYNFIAHKNIVFESRKTQKINNIFRLSDGDIHASITGVYSIINLAIAEIIDVENLLVQDSKVIGRAVALNPANSIDDGHNILWFSTQHSCQNTGSGHEWFDKLTCQEDNSMLITSTTYITKEDDTLSEVSFDNTLHVITTPILSDNNQQKNDVDFTYKAPMDESSACSRDVVITLHEDGTVKTGYKGCDDEDPTLQNWVFFEDSAKVLIEESTLYSSNSVIVIDVNLSDSLIIGGFDAP